MHCKWIRELVASPQPAFSARGVVKIERVEIVAMKKRKSRRTGVHGVLAHFSMHGLYKHQSPNDMLSL